MSNLQVGDRLEKCKQSIEDKLLQLAILQHHLEQQNELEEKILAERPTKLYFTQINLVLAELQHETGLGFVNSILFNPNRILSCFMTAVLDGKINIEHTIRDRLKLSM